jgi:hypothetical protein
VKGTKKDDLSRSKGALVRKKVVVLFAFLFALAILVLGHIEAVMLGRESSTTGLRAAAWGAVALLGLIGDYGSGY